MVLLHPDLGAYTPFVTVDVWKHEGMGNMWVD